MGVDVALLQSSFLKVIPQRQRFAQVFYETLFHDHPEVKPLFAATDMYTQQNKLFAVLSTTINNLQNPAMLRFTLHDLGKRHAGYNVKPEYYALVGDALLKAFAIVLGDAWTPQMESAWKEGYQAIAALMRETYQVAAQSVS